MQSHPIISLTSLITGQQHIIYCITQSYPKWVKVCWWEEFIG